MSMKDDSFKDDKLTNYHRVRESHHAMKRMCLAGYTNKEIAATLEITERTVCTVLNSAMMKKELELARASLDMKAINIAAEVQRLAPQAVAVLEEILHDEDAPITLRARVAMDNLSRNGVSPIVRANIDLNHHLNGEEIEQLKRNAYAAGARNGQLVLEEIKDETIDVSPSNMN